MARAFVLCLLDTMEKEGVYCRHDRGKLQHIKRCYGYDTDVAQLSGAHHGFAA